jgi:predicted outer membrane lipoprotein
MRRILLSIPAAVIGAAAFIVIGTAVWASLMDGPHRSFATAASGLGLLLACAYLGIAITLRQRHRK